MIERPTKPQCLGGKGGRFLSTAGQTSDTRLQERAIRERWPIKDEHKARIVERLDGIIRSKRASHREVVSASRALISAEAQNQTDDLTLLKLDREVPAVNINVASQAPASQEPLIDKPTLAEALALMADMGYISLSDKGQDLIEKSAELRDRLHPSGNGHGNGFVEPEYDGVSDEELFDAAE